MAALIEASDVIPVGLSEEAKEAFAEYLPGWESAGEHNLRAGAVEANVAAQLNLLVHHGKDNNHKWINDAIDALFKSDEWTAPLTPDDPDRRTKMLAAFVNFMHEASDPEAVLKGSVRTGGYAAFAPLRNTRRKRDSSKRAGNGNTAGSMVKDIRRQTRRHFSAENKIRIVLDGLRGEDSIADSSAITRSASTSHTP